MTPEEREREQAIDKILAHMEHMTRWQLFELWIVVRYVVLCSRFRVMFPTRAARVLLAALVLILAGLVIWAVTL